MLTTEAFLKLLDSAKRGASDSELSRKAGLAQNAVAGIRGGKKPSLDRAAALADAVGLELEVRVKGQLVDPLALTMAFVSMFGLEDKEPDDEILDVFLQGFASAYDYWAKFFGEEHFEHRVAAYRAARAAMAAVRAERPAFAARRDGVVQWMSTVLEAQKEREGAAAGNEEADK